MLEGCRHGRAVGEATSSSSMVRHPIAFRTRRQVIALVARSAAAAVLAAGRAHEGLAALAESRAVIDAHEFGVLGDGIHDDSPAINRAIESASARGGIVQLGTGTFRIESSPVLLSSGVSLRGIGRETLLLGLGGGDRVVGSVSATPLEPIHGASVVDLRIDGNKSSEHEPSAKAGINLWAANDCAVTGVWVENASQTGIYLAGSRNSVTDCRVSDIGVSGGIGESGIVFDTDGYNVPAGSVASGNTVTNVREHGVKVYSGGDGSSITGNSITGAGDRAIYVQGAASCIIAENTIDGAGTTGILVGGASAPADGCVVSANVVRNSASHGILVWESAGVTVSGENWVETNDGCGIYALASPFAAIASNRCIGNRGNGGIVLNGSSGSTVTANRCLGNELAGICFWDDGDPSTDCLVTANRCSDDGWERQRFGLLAGGGTRGLTVLDNDFSGNLVTTLRFVESIASEFGA